MTRATTLTGPWLALAQHCGGVGPLAQELGVSARTVARWADGTRTPGAIVQHAVILFARRRGVELTWP